MRLMTKRAAEIAIIMLVVVNAFEVVFFFAVHRGAELYRAGDQFPLPSGYLLNKRSAGEQFPLPSVFRSNNRYRPSAAAPCYLIRIYANGCAYCRRDQSQYARVVQQAQEVGCETIAMAPVARAAESYSDSRVVQLQYIDMKLGRALNPFMTPETILLDRAGRVVWSREGAMDNPSLAQAIHALDKLR
jgi:hypothetical protein